MDKHQKQVREFMLAFGQPVATCPRPLRAIDRDTRIHICEEEFREFSEAIRSNNFDDTVDAMLDIIYVIYGTALTMGIDLEPILDHVHDRNMKKMWRADQIPLMPNGAVAHPGPHGLFAILLNGKVVKPPDFVPPDVASMVNRQLGAPDCYI